MNVPTLNKRTAFIKNMHFFRSRFLGFTDLNFKI